MKNITEFYENKPMIKTVFIIANLVFCGLLLLSIILPIFKFAYGWYETEYGFFTGYTSINFILIVPILLGICACLTPTLPFVADKVGFKLDENKMNLLINIVPLVSGCMCLLSILLIYSMPIIESAKASDFSLALGGLLIMLSLGLGFILNTAVGVVSLLLLKGKINIK